MRQNVKVAAVQAAPVAFDLAQSIAKEGADLVVFP
jgi:predicted amidohydrolase